jgi:8-oxo-dGTP pyrophosphatase MutT (NUDIX family)
LTSDAQLVLGKRGNVFANEGYYTIPSGLFDYVVDWEGDKPSLEKTLVREVQEELGVEIKDIVKFNHIFVCGTESQSAPNFLFETYLCLTKHELEEKFESENQEFTKLKFIPYEPKYMFKELEKIPNIVTFAKLALMYIAESKFPKHL